MAHLTVLIPVAGVLLAISADLCCHFGIVSSGARRRTFVVAAGLWAIYYLGVGWWAVTADRILESAVSSMVAVIAAWLVVRALQIPTR